MKALFINGGPRKNWTTKEFRDNYKDEQFPKDLEAAYELGRRLVEKAKETK